MMVVADFEHFAAGHANLSSEPFEPGVELRPVGPFVLPDNQHFAEPLSEQVFRREFSGKPFIRLEPVPWPEIDFFMHDCDLRQVPEGVQEGGTQGKMENDS
ncbi:hypothetical protein SDC9_191457 [bioreactor metagenome]|uniref:Uncharacterized protein n=1 Tax=bioreactor metagenome TaxID=1076179 RepID=A0A645HZ82_9ZZZZ